MVGLVLSLTFGSIAEMLASILIIVISGVLLLYWFRYSCLLLLRNAEEHTELAAHEPQPKIVALLQGVKTASELDDLHRALNRDYHVLSYLLKHAADLQLASIENRMLILDYQLMQICYRLTRVVAPALSRKALVEMSSALDAVARQTEHQIEESV
jgi:hypothetical protein